MERLLDAALFKVMRDAVATIQAVLFLVPPMLLGNGFIAYLVGHHFNGKKVLAGVAFVVATLVVGGAVAVTFYLRNVYDPAPYELVELRGLLVIERVAGRSHHRYTLERRERIRATRNNVRLIEHRTHWTGGGLSGLCEARSLYPDHELFVGRRAEEDNRRQLWIYLGEPLGKGETATVGTREVYEDDIVSMKPYHRKGCGGFRARNLTVVTRFPVDADPRDDVEGLIWNDDKKARERATVGTVAYERVVDAKSATVDYIVTVPRPKRYHSYGIRWKAANGRGTRSTI